MVFLNSFSVGAAADMRAMACRMLAAIPSNGSVSMPSRSNKTLLNRLTRMHSYSYLTKLHRPQLGVFYRECSIA